MNTLQSIPLPAPADGKSILVRQFLRVSGLLLTLLLCGCASESPWKKQAFALNAPSTQTAATARTNVLSVRRLTVSALYWGKPFVYRTGDNSYEQDPYAEFLVAPDQMLDECVQLYLREGHAFAAVVGPDNGLHSSFSLTVAIDQLYGDFRQSDKPFAVLQMHFLLYYNNPADYGRVIWQQELSKRLPLAHRTAAALVAGWNAGLQEIMNEVNAKLKHLAVPEMSSL